MPTPTALAHGTTAKLSPAERPPAPSSHNLTGAIDFTGAPMSFSRSSEIYCESEPADYVYNIISSSVRTYRILSDGCHQIGAFYLPGDVFGLEVGAEHYFSAEAITDAKILVIKRSALVALAGRDGELAQQLCSFTAHESNRAQDHMLFVIKSVQQRVATFLLDMAGRLADAGTVELPMSRQDIADYLGLTIETVSRTLTRLEMEATVALPTSRRIGLRNRAALRGMNT